MLLRDAAHRLFRPRLIRLLWRPKTCSSSGDSPMAETIGSASSPRSSSDWRIPGGVQGACTADAGAPNGNFYAGVGPGLRRLNSHCGGVASPYRRLSALLGDPCVPL